MKVARYIQRTPKYELRYKIDSFKQDSIKDLNERRLASKIKQNGIEEDNVEMALKKVKNQCYKTCN